MYTLRRRDLAAGSHRATLTSDAATADSQLLDRPFAEQNRTEILNVDSRKISELASTKLRTFLVLGKFIAWFVRLVVLRAWSGRVCISKSLGPDQNTIGS